MLSRAPPELPGPPQGTPGQPPGPPKYHSGLPRSWRYKKSNVSFNVFESAHGPKRSIERGPWGRPRESLRALSWFDREEPGLQAPSGVGNGLLHGRNLPSGPPLGSPKLRRWGLGRRSGAPFFVMIFFRTFIFCFQDPDLHFGKLVPSQHWP